MGDSKAYIIALAAFAVTATGVHAYSGGKILQRAGLSEQQVEAFEEAHDLRKAGELEKARDVLASAGVTEETIISIKQAAKAAKLAVRSAIEAGDYAAFVAATEGSPLRDIIVTEAEFKQLVQAHELLLSGDKTAARSMFNELGLPARVHNHGHIVRHLGLSDAEEDALRAARQANDRAAVQAILEEAGIHEYRGRRDW